MGDRIVCDNISLGAVPTLHLAEDKIRVVPRRQFMITESFWEALFSGRLGILGTQMASAENKFYATVTDSGPLILNPDFTFSFQTTHTTFALRLSTQRNWPQTPSNPTLAYFQEGPDLPSDTPWHLD